MIVSSLVVDFEVVPVPVTKNFPRGLVGVDTRQKAETLFEFGIQRVVSDHSVTLVSTDHDTVLVKILYVVESVLSNFWNVRAEHFDTNFPGHKFVFCGGPIITIRFSRVKERDSDCTISGGSKANAGDSLRESFDVKGEEARTITKDEPSAKVANFVETGIEPKFSAGYGESFGDCALGFEQVSDSDNSERPVSHD